MSTKDTKRGMSLSLWPNNSGRIEMDKSEKFWDRIAKNFDKSESPFEPIHVKTLENSKKYLNLSDTVLD